MSFAVQPIAAATGDGETVALAQWVKAVVDAIIGLALSTDADGQPMPPSVNVVFRRMLNLDASTPPVVPPVGQPVRIDIFPGSEQRDADGIDLLRPFKSHLIVHMVIQQQVGAAAETQGPLLMTLRSQIIDALCDVPTAQSKIDSAVRPFYPELIRIGVTGKGIYDLERLEGDNVFYSETILTFKASL